MAKTRSFRVAVEGATTDGRVIERSWIQEMAETYNPDTYGARINMEHIKGYSPEAPFNAYGDVLSLEAKEVDIELAGKTEKKLALFATLDVTDELVALNGKKQKLYTSIEVNPNMAGTGKAYLMGLAVTDNPASLGTEMLAFASKATVNPFAGRKSADGTLFTAADEFKLELETPAADDKKPGPLEAFAAILVEKLTGKTPEPPKTPEPVVADGAFTAAAAQEMFAGLTKAMGEELKGFRQDFTNQIGAVKSDFATLKADIEKTPTQKHSARPDASGGDGRQLADF